MKRVFTSAGWFLNVFCLLASFPNGWAGTIDPAGLQGALVSDNSSDLVLPGTPLPDYMFPGNLNFFRFSFGPGDPALFDLGLGNGSFLFTGNTNFNFTGDPELVIFEGTVPAPPVSPRNNLPAVPEPASLWLLAGACLAAGIRKTVRHPGYWGPFKAE